MTTTINADNGAVSGSAGLKSSADATGVLALQTNGTTAVTVDASQNVTLAGTLTTTGVTTFQAGTAALPAITTTGDTNTGIFFPAADTIAFSEGGVEAMRIDSSGNVGIGTASPQTKLDVSSGSLRINEDGAGTKIITVRSNFAGVGPAINVTTNDPLLLMTNNTERARIDSSGNVGIGTTSPSTFGLLAVKKDQTADTAISVSNQGSTNAATTMSFTMNEAGSAQGWLRRYRDGSGNTEVGFSDSLLFTGSVTGTKAERARIDSSGNLGIGTSSPSSRLDVQTPAATNGGMTLGVAGSMFGTLGSGGFAVNGGAITDLGIRANANMLFATGSGAPLRMTLDSSGNLLVGTTSGSNHQIKKAVSVGSLVLEVIGNNVGCTFFNGDGGTPNAANAVLKVTSVGATGRSINAAGTVNAAGADYAEYMTKSGDFIVAKGDVVGIDAQGKLTNVFANAMSFVVKSTNPSYVGGDTWGGDIEGDELEAARQTVDRIAFAGQVPVNVIGASAGQYIIPVNNNGAIKGQAVSNPTFEQYQSSVGKVIAIEADGRARIIVKVA